MGSLFSHSLIADDVATKQAGVVLRRTPTCFQVDFSETSLMASAELKITFQSLQIWKFSEGGYPQTPPTSLLSSALSITTPPPPSYKKLSYGPVLPFSLTIVPFLLHLLGHIACRPLYRPQRIFHLDPKGLWVLLSLLRHCKWCSLDLDIVFCKCSLQSLCTEAPANRAVPQSLERDG